MYFNLPKTVNVAGREMNIRWEYRDVLTILAAASDPDLSAQDKALAALAIFYEDADAIPPEAVQEALERVTWFIDGGAEAPKRGGPRLMDWEQDFPWIVAPVNRVLGRDIREETPLHWWSFLAAYYEIGDCTFAQIVRIRDAQARGKKLDKAEREWARRNGDLIRLRSRYAEADDDLLKAWTKGGDDNAG